MNQNLENELAQFTGTENWHRFNPLMRNVLATDGAMHLAEKGEAFWLLDIIGSLKLVPKCANAPFITCKLVKNEDGGATFTATNGNNTKLYTQEISYTDFPLDEITLYFIDNVILLPSEY
jgi:hypothetical protein